MGNFFKLRGIYNSDGLYQFGKNGVQIDTNTVSTFKFRNAANNADVNITANQITSTVTTGTPPLVVTSTTPVANLVCDSANTVYDQNTGTFKKFWTGTQTQYNLLTPDANTIYFITGI